MSNWPKYLIRFLLLLAVQVYVLDKVPHLHRYITPYLYFVFIIWMPFSVGRISLLFLGFFTGLMLDYFQMTPGLHAAACVLIAFIRPFIINVLTPKDNSEFNYREPSPQAMQWTPYAVYVIILTLLHNGYMLFLEFLDAGSFLDMVIRIISTTGISLLLIFTAEMLFPRKLKFRTNTA